MLRFSAHRVVRHFLASRPIHVDKRAAQAFVEKTLIPALVEKFEALPQDEPLGSRKLLANRGFTLDAVDHKETLRVMVEVFSVPSYERQAVIAGVLSQSELKGRDFYDIKLKINGGLTPAECLGPNRMLPISRGADRRRFPYGLYLVLIHELTHAAEGKYLRAPSYDMENIEPESVEGGSLYYNDPMEVRAFMQQVVDEVSRKATALRDNWEWFPLDHAMNNRQFVDECLSDSYTWGRIKRFLNPTNRAKILKAVYTELDEKGLLR